MQYEGYLQFPDERKRWVEYASGQGRPNLFFLNGLPDSTKSWHPISEPLIEQGFGTVSMDFSGQGRTLSEETMPLPATTWREHCADAVSALDALGVQSVTGVGLSMGGGIGLALASEHKDRFARMIAIAPYLEPIQPHHQLLQRMVEFSRPYLKDADPDQLYELWFDPIVRYLYPLTERAMWEQPNMIPAVLRNAMSMLHFRAVKMAANSPNGSIIVVQPEHDAIVKASITNRYWSDIPQAKRGLRVIVRYGKHRVTAQFASLMRDLIAMLALAPAEILDGSTITLNPLLPLAQQWSFDTERMSA